MSPAVFEGHAHGKLILLGEHAVVHGTPALVAGVDRGVVARHEAASEGRQLRLLERETHAGDDADDLGRAFAALLDAAGASEPCRVVVSGDLPAGMGLGFSAAAAVAIARAVQQAQGREGADEVEAMAMAWERVFHGNPSGVDVAAAMRGGCTRFSRREGTRSVPLGRPLHLAVGLTGTASSTKVMVDGVADLLRRQPDVTRKNIDGIATLVDNAVSAVEAGDVVALGELMNLNQMLLSALLVSNDAIERLVSIAREAGALGAKLTGAGGGGAVVALAAGPDEAYGVVKAWADADVEGFATSVGGAA
ncbi:MAG: mevalonate kinase [Polyangiaceae bacterium]